MQKSQQHIQHADVVAAIEPPGRDFPFVQNLPAAMTPEVALDIATSMRATGVREMLRWFDAADAVENRATVDALDEARVISGSASPVAPTSTSIATPAAAPTVPPTAAPTMDWVSSRDAAEIAGRSIDCIEKWRDAKKIEARKLAGRWYYNPDSLKRYLRPPAGCT